jgi:hypothetical protein
MNKENNFIFEKDDDEVPALPEIMRSGNFTNSNLEKISRLNRIGKRKQFEDGNVQMMETPEFTPSGKKPPNPFASQKENYPNEHKNFNPNFNEDALYHKEGIFQRKILVKYNSLLSLLFINSLFLENERSSNRQR